MFFCEALPCFVLYDRDTSLFGVSQFFDSLIRPLGVVIFQVVFNANALFFDPFLFSFFMMFLISVFTLLYLSLPSVSPFLFFSSLLLSHRSRMSEVTHGFFIRRCLPMLSLAVSVTAMFIAVTIYIVYVIVLIFK